MRDDSPAPRSDPRPPNGFEGIDPELLSELEQRRANRPAVRARYKSLFVKVVDLFYEVDPVGINFGVNPEEYQAEVYTVLPRLEAARSLDDVVQVLDEEFLEWFGRRYTVEPLAKLLWPMWLAWKETPDGRGSGT